MIYKIVIYVFVLFLTCNIYTYADNINNQSPFSKLPFRFRENKGQWEDKIQFGAWSGSANVYFLNNGLSISHWRNNKKGTEALTWNIDFLGANKVSPTCTDYRNVAINYTKQNQSILIDKEYALLNYQEIYEHIDLQYYGYESTLKYDYILKPGAVVSHIKMHADGINKFEIKDGELITHHAWGTVKENKPYSYQIINGKEVEVQVNFKLYNKNTYGFEIVGNYDKNLNLIIDPIELIWGTYVGSTNPNSQGYMYDIAIDSDKAIYGTGYYQTSFPTTSGAFQTNFKGGDINGSNGDAYLYKISSDGKQLIFSTYIGGIRDEEGKAIWVTEAGRVYIAGVTNSTDFPTTASAYQKTRKGLSDGFIACFDKYQGSLLYSTYLGGISDDQINDIKIDDIGNVWVGGETKSPDLPVKNPTIQGSYQGGVFDGFLTKLTANLDDILYSTFVGGAGDDKVNALASFSNTITYTGYSGSTNYITTAGAYQRNLRGGLDVIVGRLNTSNNTLLYSSYIGGGFDDVGNDIDCNASGTAFITGYTMSANYPNTTGTTLKGLSDVFVTSILSSGSSLGFSRLVGGKKDEQGTSIIVNAMNQTFVAGNSNSIDFPLNQVNALDKEDQVFLFSVDYTGNYLAYSMMLGGSKNDYETPRLAFSSKEFLCEVVIGFTSHSTDLPTTQPSEGVVYQYQKMNGGTENDQPALFKYYFGPALPFCSTQDNYFDYKCLACPTQFCCRSTKCEKAAVVCPGPVLLDVPAKPNDPNYFQRWSYYLNGNPTTLPITVNVNQTCPPLIDIFNVRYDDGCSSFTKTFKFNTPCPQLNIDPDIIYWCVGSGPISIHANMSGYTHILWNTGDTTTTISVNAAGWYKAKGFGDQCGTTASDSVYVSPINGPPLNPFATNNTATYCFPGTYTISGLDANDPIPVNTIKYKWSTGATSPTISITQGGVYCLTKSNACGSINSCFTVNEIRKPVVNLGKDTILCQGQTLTLKVPDEYKLNPILWSTGATGTSITGLPGNTYWVEVTNACGTTRDSIVLGVSPNIPTINLGPDINKCSPTDFPILLDAGFVNATYLWSTGATTKTITITSGGQYWVKLSNGCGTASDTINITSNPTLTLGPDQRFCSPSTTTLTVPDYGIGTTYLWSTGSTGKSITVSQTGSYWVKVTNTCGVAKDTVNITVDQGRPQPNLGPDFFICPGTTRILTAGTNGTSYLWNTGALTNSISINTSGTYWVEVNNSCGTKRDTVIVTTQPPLYTNLPSDTSICNPNILLLSVPLQNATYLWSTGSTSNSIIVSTSGIYTVRLTNACQQITQSVNVSFVSTKPTVNLGPDIIHCGPSPINVTLSATTSNVAKYQWNTGAVSTSILATQKGLYWLKVSNGCGTQSDSLYIIGDLEPTGINDFSLCNAAPVELNARNEGATYLWKPGNQTSQKITVGSTGQYIVTINNACGVLKDTIIVSIETAPPVFDLGPNFRLCSPVSKKIGQSIIGSQYLWSTGSTDSTIIVSQTGTYSLTVTNACGATTDNIFIKVDNGIPVVNLGDDKQVCKPVSLILDAGTTDNLYNWIPGNVTDPIYPVFNEGQYIVQVSNACGSDKDTINIYSYSKPVLSFKDTGTCNTPVLLDASNPPASYFWTPGGAVSSTYLATQSGTYTVYLTHPCGLIPATSNVIINTSVPLLNLGNDTLLCTPDGFILDAGVQEGGKYKWTPGGSIESTLAVKTAGKYKVEVTNYCGTSKDSIEVGANPINVVALPDTTVCYNTSLHVRTPFVSGYDWEWYNENDNTSIIGTNNIIEVSPSYPYTNYVVKARKSPCYNLDTVSVNVYKNVDPKIVTTDNEGYIPLALNFIDANKSGTKYSWNFDDGGKSSVQNPGHIFKQERYYTVSVHSENDFGCYGDDTIQILAFDLFIPNLVTANGDNMNDNWHLTKLNPYLYVEIYNRWEDKVYSKSGYIDEWRGEGLSEGVYYFYIKDVKYNKEFRGWVQLIK